MQLKNKRNDHISELPDDLLLAILDRLDVRNAARTGVLCKRWRQLPAILSRLIIDVNSFLPNGVRKPSVDESVHANDAVVQATESMLTRRKSNGYVIRLLRMIFYLRDDNSISIGHTVGGTATQQTEFIILTEKGGHRCTDDDFVRYGRQFTSFFNACPDAFGGLTRLHLMNLWFRESDVPNVLNACRRLVHFRLLNCGVQTGVSPVLRFVHSRLKDLSIFSSDFERIELNRLPNLTHLTFEGWISFQDPLFFGHVPMLEAVNLGSTCLNWHETVKLTKLLDNSSVRDLILNFKSEKVWVHPEDPKSLAPVFRKLHVVSLNGVPEGFDLTWMMFILDAAPSLKELYVTVWDHVCEMKLDEERRKAHSCKEKNVEWEASNCEHHSLATLTIFNFQPEEYLMRCIRRVMTAAVNLGDVYLYRRPACRWCRGKYPRPFRYPCTSKQRCSLRNRIAQEGTGSLAEIHFPAALRPEHVAKECSARSVFLKHV